MNKFCGLLTFDSVLPSYTPVSPSLSSIRNSNTSKCNKGKSTHGKKANMIASDKVITPVNTVDCMAEYSFNLNHTINRLKTPVNHLETIKTPDETPDNIVNHFETSVVDYLEVPVTGAPTIPTILPLFAIQWDVIEFKIHSNPKIEWWNERY